MSKFNSILRTLAVIAVLGGALVTDTLRPMGAFAQPEQASNGRSRQSKFGGFFAPQGRDMPQNTEGGASRGRCVQNGAGHRQAVTLLTPQGNSGLTVAARPTFWAYIDQDAAEQVFFSLKNQDESYFYEMTMSLAEADHNLVKFQLPQGAPELQAGEQYTWSVAVICGRKLGPDSPWASGWIERVSETELSGGEVIPEVPMERASYYGRKGVWYETVATLAALHERQPNSATQAAWSELLAESGVETEL